MANAKCQKADATWLTAITLVCVLGAASQAAAQQTHLVVVVGLAGQPEHGETFRRWAGSLVDHATERLGIARDRIVYLLDDPVQDAKRATGKSTKDAIEGALASTAAAARPEDLIFVVLIGHGTWDGKVAKFNLPGPDMTGADFAAPLKAAQTKNIVFVDTSSASGPFIEPLSKVARVVVTATRNGAEQFATVFGGYFVDALASDAADADKNKRVSVLEAFTAAKAEVAKVYQQRGIMLTERALLDDNGDGEGSLDPAANGKDGSVAAVMSLGAPVEALKLPDDPKLRTLYEERRDLERRAEALKMLKAGMDPAKYASELEKVLTELARKSQEIRALEGKGK